LLQFHDYLLRIRTTIELNQANKKDYSTKIKAERCGDSQGNIYIFLAI